MQITPKPGDIIVELSGETFICTTSTFLHTTYGMTSGLPDGRYTYGYHVDLDSTYGISWSFWPKDEKFGKVIQAQCNRTYHHGDAYQGRTLLSVRLLKASLALTDAEFVYITGHALKAYSADPLCGDTLVLTNGSVYTVCTLGYLQDTFGLGLHDESKPQRTYGFCPTADLKTHPVYWMSWGKDNCRQDEYAIASIIPAMVNRPTLYDGSQAQVNGVQKTLLSRLTLVDFLSNTTTGFVTFDGSALLPVPHLVEAS